jgi:hypothetical protein
VANQGTVGELIAYVTQNSGHVFKGEENFDAWWPHLCGWPPNVFAVSATILHESGLYRVQPEKYFGKVQLDMVDEWVTAIASVRLSERPEPCCSVPMKPLPNWLTKLGNDLKRILGKRYEPNDDSADHEARETLCTLHCLADDACLVMAFPDEYDGRSRVRGPVEPGQAEPKLRPRMPNEVRQQALKRLCAVGTTSCFDTSKIRILPKKHTPQVGVTLRSLSLYAAAVRGSEVDVNWTHLVPEAPAEPAHDRDDDDQRLTNLLLIPWPFEVQASAFRAELPPKVSLIPENESFHPPRRLDDSRDFAYDPRPSATDNLGALVTGLLKEAENRKVKIHGVIFPELALTNTEFEEVANCLRDSDEAKEAFLLSGVRERPDGQEFPRNEAWFQAGGELVKQEKHHKWRLDAGQIRQYDLGSVLLPKQGRRYWERMRVAKRSIHFVHWRTQLALCHLICEDLARVEPVGEVIRAVGPNLVVGLLFDGPQMERRWPGRYASIFADDPGSSVLTLSALGMVQRSRGPEGPRSRIVALWKDQLTGARELSLPENHHALLLSLCTNDETEWTYDGRDEGTTTGVLTFGSVEPLRTKT